jgi:glycosyltransferase involved in cell wall biosynthesis
MDSDGDLFWTAETIFVYKTEMDSCTLPGRTANGYSSIKLQSKESRDLRPRVDGKFLRVNGERFLIKGVTYGSFARNADGEPFPPFRQLRDDFARMREAGINSVRLYSPPSDRIADAAAENGLYLIPDICWGPRRCELDDPERVKFIFNWTREHTRRLAQHPSILVLGVGNEIPPLVVRWYGRRRIEAFLRDLYTVVKEEAPAALVTYAKHPPTEYLRLPFLEIESFNVYLEREADFRSYLARLQALAGERPLFLSELGLDATEHSEVKQAATLHWQLRAVFEKGLCGAAIYAWTDEWAIFEQEIRYWGFGLTRRDRRAKPALDTMRKIYQSNYYELRGKEWPLVSVVVASCNAERTLDQTLKSLDLLNYPNYEVIVIDDGSVDNTAEIARQHRGVRLISIENNGLSHARNLGIEAATGSIVAFIDSDAYADPDWLYFLVTAMEQQDAVAAGGPNLIPPEDGFIARCVNHAPGNPTHVLLSDELAEHVPGCNMAFNIHALHEIGEFDPRHRVAGDDVDICWKLLANRKRIAFSPTAVVWHHRRPTIRSFLRQQKGYGFAEAHLFRRYPGRFNVCGDLVWRGRIYDGPHNAIRQFGLLPLLRPRIYQGFFCSAQFQSIYQPLRTWSFQIFTTAEWHLLIWCTLFSGILARMLDSSAWRLLLELGAAMFLTTICVAAVPAVHAVRANRWQGLKAWMAAFNVAFLHVVQPLARAIGLLHGWWHTRRQRVDTPAVQRFWANMRQRDVWLEELQRYLRACGWSCRASDEWDTADVDVLGPGPYRLQICSVYEENLERSFHMVRYRVTARMKGVKLALWTAIALTIGLIAALPYLLPLTLPLAIAARGLARAKRHMVTAVSQLALECAEGLGLQKVREDWFV